MDLSAIDSSPASIAARSTQRPLDRRVSFETYLAAVAARFQNLEPEGVDAAIGEALEGLLEVLDLDRCGAGLFSPSSRAVRPTYNAVRPGVESLQGVDVARLGPAYARQARNGSRLIFSRLPDDLPERWDEERAYVRRSGMKSHVLVPMIVGSELQGALGMSTFRSYREWTPDLVSRLELLASVIGSAVQRRTGLARVQDAEALTRSVLASLTSHIAVVDAGGRTLVLNEAWTRAAAGERLPAVAPGGDFLEAVERSPHRYEDPMAVAEGIRGVAAGRSARFETLCRPLGEGRASSYLLTATPLLGGGGGVVVVHTDVTELEQARRALEASLAELREIKERVEAENVRLQQEVRHAHGFDEIVGTSAALARVLAQVEQVAPTDAPVLLLGETGTGKDLVARAVHERSRRALRPLVIVNCAALPGALVESELFGYEKGAFTGALQRTLGRFEVANGGTLFLDEIGELPLELQAKLLRVLQTGEFERLGSAKTLTSDVRLVIATNRDLAREVREGRFRADLYYRLNVFPVTLPPLRERPEDIPLLAWHFIARKQVKLGRSVESISEPMMQSLVAYAWPGNVRELENVVERALIMTTGATLAMDPRLVATPALGPAGPESSLAEVERAHILAVLALCGWKVAGKGNAAARLGLNRSTLQYRMKRLGIEKPQL